MMKKRLLSTLLMLCMALALLPGTALAAVTSGKCGDNLTWSLSNGTLTIEGTGSMYNYSQNGEQGNYPRSPWFDSRNGIYSVKIGNGVTSIGSYAFLWSSLTNVTIPDGVTSIGEGAFAGCSSLRNVTIPKSVTNIVIAAFNLCSSLNDVYYGGSEGQWKQIAIEMYNAPLLEAAVYYNSNSAPTSGKCGDNATWSLNNGMLTISGTGDMYSYSDESKPAPWDNYRNEIKTVKIGNGVTSIGGQAFSNCGSLTSVTIPGSVTTIGDRAFIYCDSLTSLTIPTGVTSIKAHAFSGCGKLTSVTIPHSVTNIEPWAFSGCSSLTNVTIPSSITTIEMGIFSGCTGLTSVTIPASVTRIDAWAFNDCANIKNVYYGGSENQWKWVEVGDNNRWLYNTDIRYNGGIAPASGKCGDNLTWSLNNGTLTIQGTGKMENYGQWDYNLGNPTRPPWYDGGDKIHTVKIGNGVTTIGENAFIWCDNLINVTIPNSVITIGQQAFCGCSSLTSVTIPDSVTSIGMGAFFWCSSLKDVYYSGSKNEWGRITIASDNEPFTSATIHYNSAPPAFADVPVGAYYTDAVAWAVEKGITSGTGNGAFSPESDCTRSQIVTFLWRAYGQPEPTSSVNQFTDVNRDAYYYKAVLWAAEKGITSGTGGTNFGINGDCTRAQAVTFLWRAAGQPTAKSNSSFSDVDSGAYYAEAVKWAVENNITSGTGNGRFSPDQVCTRAQIVTFLYRALSNQL